MASVWDFFAPALCPLVTDFKLSDHTHLLTPAADVLEPYTSQLGVPEGSEYRLIAPMFMFFGSIFIFSYILWGMLGVKGAERALFASCCMSMVHGGSTTIFAGAEACRAHPGIQYDMPNNPEQDDILALSTAYFFADLFFYLIPFITETDPLFIGHHLATSGYMLWSIHIKKGAISSLMLMFLGEVSSVFFNPWLAARDYKKISGGKSVIANIVFEIFTWPYSIIFIGVRGIIAPVVLLNMIRGLVASTELSDATKFAWVTLIILSFLASLIWVRKLTIGFSKFLKKKIFGASKKKSA